jgi:hypothetical protein
LSQWHCFSVLRGGHKRVIDCDRAIFNCWRAIFVLHCRCELHGFSGNTDLEFDGGLRAAEFDGGLRAAELDGGLRAADTGHQ